MIAIRPPIRGNDKFGSGRYLAPRGNRQHRGIDLSCYQGSEILSPSAGTVTKIGYPYSPSDPKKGHLRYVQVTEKGMYRCRYFYVRPTVLVGADIRPGDKIGISQGLTKIYPGITDHIHFEVIEGERNYLDPTAYLSGII